MGHHYEVETNYRGGLAGKGSLKSLGLETSFSAPKDLGGVGLGTNPEELLGAAAGTCYLITLGTILQFQGVTGLEFSNRSEVEAEVENGRPVLKKITHYPVVKVPKGTAQEILSKVQAAIHRAEFACIVSQAVKNNLEVKVVSKVEEATT